MRFKDWVSVMAAMVAIVAMAGTAMVWAGDQRWVTGTQIDIKLQQVEVAQQKQIQQIEINQLDREITFLQIKINQGEATSSDKIYAETLRQQLRALKGRSQ